MGDTYTVVQQIGLIEPIYLGFDTVDNMMKSMVWPFGEKEMSEKETKDAFENGIVMLLPGSNTWARVIGRKQKLGEL